MTATQLTAEEQNQDAASPSVYGNSFTLFSHHAPFQLSTVPEQRDYLIGDLFTGSGGSTSLPAARAGTQMDCDDDSTVTLFKKQRTTRRTYHAWATFGTGFGQFFSSCAFGRSRTNGVGIEDRDFFYLKMNVQF